MTRDVEYLTSNRRIRFPFVDDSVLTYVKDDSSDSSSSPGALYSERLADNLALSVFGCFVDAYIQVKSPYFKPIPSLKDIYQAGRTIYFTLFDASGTYSERSTLSCTRSTTRFPIIKGENAWCWYVFVLASAGIKEFEENREKIGDISQNCLNFSEKCISGSAPYVSSLWIYGGKSKTLDGSRRLTRLEALENPPDAIVTGDIPFKPGYNMEITQGTNYLETLNGLELTANPGAGLGVAPCDCDDTYVEYKTPGLISKDGHTRMFNDTCYDLVPRLDSHASGYLMMHVKCKACCQCETYGSIVTDKLMPLHDEIINDKKSIDESYATYENYVAKWNTRIATALPEDIVITMTGSLLDAAATDIKSKNVSGYMNRCGFTVIFRNDSFVQVNIELNSCLSNGDIFGGQLSYMKDAETPVLMSIDLQTSKNPILSVSLQPGRSAMLTYFVRLRSRVSTDVQTGFISSITASAYQDSRLIDTRTERITK